MRGYVLIDGRNVAFAHDSTGELKFGKERTQAIYGFVNSLRALVVRFPMLQPLVLWDGKSWRYSVFDGYKSKRKVLTPQSEKMLKDLDKQIVHIKKIVRALGVAQLHADNFEADDLAGYMVSKFKKDSFVLYTSDKDWAQLVSKNVQFIDPVKDRKIHIKLSNISDLGVASPKQWLEHKCLAGDSSDCIPGVGGIGEKGAKELLKTYGSVKNFLETVENEKTKLPKKLEALYSDPEKMKIFERNMLLMDLRHPKIPKPKNLKTEHRPIDTKKAYAMCNALGMKSITSRFNDWVDPFIP